MRISARTYDRDYFGNMGSKFKVCLDGVPVKDCVEADDARGYVIVMERDANGRIAYDPVEVCALTRCIEGHVTITKE